MSNSAYLFGAKLASAITFYERQPADKQKKKNPLMRAEAAGESEETEDLFPDDLNKESAAYKFGKSMCHTMDMSKHDRSKYQTGPMRALSAEEAVKPADGGVTETQETEHSEKDIAHSGQKASAYKQAVKGGVGGAFGGLVGDAMRRFGKTPVKTPPKLPTQTPKVKTTPQDVAGVSSTPATPAPAATPKVTATPAEAAAGRAAVKITPQETQRMQDLNAIGRGFSLPAAEAATPVAARAARQNAATARRARLEAGGGSAEDLQEAMGPTFREYNARAAGAGRTPPPVPPKPATPTARPTTGPKPPAPTSTPTAPPTGASAAPTALNLGNTILPAGVKPGATLNHKQFGAGRVTSIDNGTATVEFPGQPPRQYRVSGGNPAAAPTAPPASPVAAAAPAAAPPRTPSIPDRAFSAARAYGNATGVAPTSMGGLAMFGLNPMLQQGAGMLDQTAGTNFAGNKSNQNDWTSRVGQVAFPTSRVQSYLGQQIPGWLQQAQQIPSRIDSMLAPPNARQ